MIPRGRNPSPEPMTGVVVSRVSRWVRFGCATARQADWLPPQADPSAVGLSWRRKHPTSATSLCCFARCAVQVDGSREYWPLTTCTPLPVPAGHLPWHWAQGEQRLAHGDCPRPPPTTPPATHAPIPAPLFCPYTPPIPPHTKGSGFVLGSRERQGARRTAWMRQLVQGNVCRPRARRGSTSVPMRGRMAVSTVRRGGPPPSRVMGRWVPHHQRIPRPRRPIPAARAAPSAPTRGAPPPSRRLRARARLALGAKCRSIPDP